MSLPTDGEITTAIRLILRDANLDSLTVKGVRKMLEDQFNVSLAYKKDFLKQEVQSILQEQTQMHQEDIMEDHDEDQPNFSDFAPESEIEEEAEPVTKKRKASSESKSPAKKAKTSTKSKAKSAAKGGKNTPSKAKGKAAKGKKASPGKKGKGKLKKKVPRDPSLNGGLSTPQPVSAELADFLGGQTHIARSDVVKALWVYIKQHNLQNPEHRREIACDARLQRLFEKPMVTMFEMNKLISKHFLKPPGWQPKSKSQGKTGESKGGLQTPSPISEELSRFLGGLKEIARSEVVKRLWQYIKSHNLQNPENKKEIICDPALESLLGQERVDMFQMNKLIGVHFVRAIPS